MLMTSAHVDARSTWGGDIILKLMITGCDSITVYYIYIRIKNFIISAVIQ